MLRRLAGGVFSWTAAVPSSSRPGVTYAHTGFALAVGEAAGTVLVDPPALTADECAHLERIGVPTHILLTCEWHTRAAAQHRARWGCRVLMHAAGGARADVPLDGWLEDGALLWEAVRVVHLPEVYYPEEVALLVESARPEPFLLLGDALSGGREDAGVPEGEVALHAPRYVADFAKAHGSLTRLLGLRFGAAAFGHGTPVLDGAAALERCLRSEVAWLASGGREGSLDRLADWPDRLLYERYLAAAGERARGIPALPHG